MRNIQFGGRVHQFPDDAPDEMISKALKSWDQERQASNPDAGEEMPNSGWDADNYVDMLALAEGTKAHKSIEGGVDTRAYGVKFIPNGVDKTLKGKALATAVAGWHKDSVASSLAQQQVDLEGYGSGLQTMLVDLHYNAGSLFSTTPKKLAEGDLEGAVFNTLNIIGATENGKKVTYGGLATRRARFANLALAELGLPPIAQVEMTALNPRQTGGAQTQYRYLDADGNEIHKVRTNRPLSQTKLAGGKRIVDVPGFEE